MRCSNCGRDNPADAAFCANCGFALTAPPQAQPGPVLPTPLAPAVIPEAYMGFWVRLVAAIVDGVILGAISGLLSFALPQVVGTALAWVINILYYWLFTGLKGQTPGKMLIGAKVVDEQGRIPGLWIAFLREVPGKIVSTVFLLIGYVWIAFDAKKQGWHDKIAGTLVVHSRA